MAAFNVGLHWVLCADDVYTTVGGWMLSYMVKSASGTFTGLDAGAVAGVFDAMLANPAEMIGWMLVVVVLCFFVCSMGLQKGVERITKVMMACLFVILVVLCVRSVTLPGAGAGFEFYLVPDFSRMFQGSTTAERWASFGEAVYAAMGRDFAMGLLPISGCSGDISVEGFVTKPLNGHGTRGRQLFFVNGRFIKSQLLTAALEEAYRNQLLKGKFPRLRAAAHHARRPVGCQCPPRQDGGEIRQRQGGLQRRVLHGAGRLNTPAPQPKKPRQESFYQTMTVQQYRERCRSSLARVHGGGPAGPGYGSCRAGSSRGCCWLWLWSRCPIFSFWMSLVRRGHRRRAPAVGDAGRAAYQVRPVHPLVHPRFCHFGAVCG